MLFARRDDVDWVLMIKSGKQVEYPYPLLHGFVKGDYELGRIFRWLDDDWDFKKRKRELTVKLAEETLTKFGWHWDSPENVRQSALREAIAVHGLWHLRRCLLFLERTWSEMTSIKRRIASDAVHLERLWFMRDCMKPSSDFQRQMCEFWRLLRDEADRARKQNSELNLMLTKRRIAKFELIERYFVRVEKIDQSLIDRYLRE